MKDNELQLTIYNIDENKLSAEKKNVLSNQVNKMFSLGNIKNTGEKIVEKENKMSLTSDELALEMMNEDLKSTNNGLKKKILKMAIKVLKKEM